MLFLLGFGIVYKSQGHARLAQLVEHLLDVQRVRDSSSLPSDVNASAALHSLLNAGYRQTLGTWKNLTATTARTVTGQFEAALDRAWLQVSSGAFDYQTAIKRAVDGLAARMLGVTYPTGHHDTLEVAARRAVDRKSVV